MGDHMDRHTPIAPKLKTTKSTTLLLSQKIFKGYGPDSGLVKDSNDKIIFKINSNLFSLGLQRRIITDPKGNSIGQLRRQNISSVPTFFLGTMDDEKKCSVKMKGMLDFTNKCEADIYLQDLVIGAH